jgi:hypothetical protein
MLPCCAGIMEKTCAVCIIEDVRYQRLKCNQYGGRRLRHLYRNSEVDCYKSCPFFKIAYVCNYYLLGLNFALKIFFKIEFL